MEKGHLTNDDVIDVVGEMIIEKITDNDERKVLIDMAKDFYKTTMEGI